MNTEVRLVDGFDSSGTTDYVLVNYKTVYAHKLPTRTFTAHRLDISTSVFIRCLGAKRQADSNSLSSAQEFSMSAHYSVSNNALITTGRLLLSLLFIPAGLDKVIHYKETIDYVASAGLPLAEVTTSFAAAIEILAGIALLLGFHARIAAFTLAAFTLVASLFFHAYWGVAPEQQLVTQLLFFKNIAIIGGLLSVAAHSASDWSLDHYFGQRHSRDAHQSLNEEKQQPEPLTPGQ